MARSWPKISPWLVYFSIYKHYSGNLHSRTFYFLSIFTSLWEMSLVGTDPTFISKNFQCLLTARKETTD